MARIDVYVTKQAIVRVHHADITPEERERRIEKTVKPALAKFGRAAMERGIDLQAYAESTRPRFEAFLQEQEERKEEREALLAQYLARQEAAKCG